MASSDMPHDIAAFAHLVNVLLTGRPVGYDKHLDRTPGPAGSHQPGNLNRNRAAILFHDLKRDVTIGTDWLGVSGRSELHLSKGGGLKVLWPEEDGSVDVGKILGMKQSVRLENVFQPQNSHGLCSEVALLNGLAHYIVAFRDQQLGRASERPCTLYLLTERLPCGSCTRLLKDFLQKFTSTRLHVGYMFDITSDSQEVDAFDFMRKIGGRVNVYKIQAISNKDTGYLAPHGKPQWHPPGISSAARENISSDETRYLASIVRIDFDSASRGIAPKSMPSRNPGQPSAHFTAQISPDIRHAARKNAGWQNVVFGVLLVSAGVALFTLAGRRMRTRPS